MCKRETLVVSHMHPEQGPRCATQECHFPRPGIELAVLVCGTMLNPPSHTSWQIFFFF